MKSGALVFLAALVALSASWGGFVLAPQIQLGRGAQTNAVGSSDLYPLGRPGLARQGLEVYRANGCVYCHSQQVGQTGTAREVVLMDAGTNAAATVAAIGKLNSSLAKSDPRELLAGLPKTVLRVTDMNAADPGIKDLQSAGAKAGMRVVPQGPDIARGWGKRRTTAQDYLADYPVQLGSRRIGPDLANVGLRLQDANWHLRHLYAPQNEVKGSTMPPYRFLFETRKVGREASPAALKLSGELSPAPGYEIVPKPEATALMAYLLSLRADAPLFEAPLTPPPGSVASTNARATSTNAPGVATNAATAILYNASELIRILHARSADLQSAVSPICNRQGVQTPLAHVELFGALQNEILRYTRLQICATPLPVAFASHSGSQSPSACEMSELASIRLLLRNER